MPGKHIEQMKCLEVNTLTKDYNKVSFSEWRNLNKFNFHVKEEDKIRRQGDHLYPACRTFQQVIMRGVEEKDSKDERNQIRVDFNGISLC